MCEECASTQGYKANHAYYIPGDQAVTTEDGFTYHVSDTDNYFTCAECGEVFDTYDEIGDDICYHCYDDSE